MRDCTKCSVKNDSLGFVDLEVGAFFKDRYDNIYLIGKVGDIFVGMDAEDFPYILLFSDRGIPLKGFDPCHVLVKRVDFKMDTCGDCRAIVETEYPAKRETDVECN